MNGKRFWMVSMVAVALTLFSSFVFANLSIKQMQDYIDSIALNADEMTIAIVSQMTEIENNPQCRLEGALEQCSVALEIVDEAREHIKRANAALKAFKRSHKPIFSVNFYSEAARATQDILSAGIHLSYAYVTIC